MFQFKSSKPIIAGLLFFGFVYGFFICHWVPDNSMSFQGGRCYSSNKQYYLSRYITPWVALEGSFFDSFGEIRLFDKSGKLLSKGEAMISSDAGPHWLSGDPSVAGTDLVFFMNGVGNGDGWSAKSPTFFGSFPPFRNCASMEETSPVAESS